MYFKHARLIAAAPFVLRFEGNDDAEAEAAVAAAAAAEAARLEAENKNKPRLDKATQDYVNSLLKKERTAAEAKAERKNNELITQLETQRNLATTTASERTALEERIENLRAEFATKEQLTQQTTEKRVKQLEADNKQKDAETTTWRNRFTETLVTNSLTEAAVKGKAFNPNQVVTILQPHTRVEEIVGDDNKPTGKFTTKVKLPAKDKDGNPTILELGPTEAVKQLSEMPEEYGNLFISGAAGGLGGGSLGRNGANGTKDMATLPTGDYIAERKKQKQAAINRKKGS